MRRPLLFRHFVLRRPFAFINISGCTLILALRTGFSSYEVCHQRLALYPCALTGRADKSFCFHQHRGTLQNVAYSPLCFHTHRGTPRIFLTFLPACPGRRAFLSDTSTMRGKSSLLSLSAFTKTSMKIAVSLAPGASGGRLRIPALPAELSVSPPVQEGPHAIEEARQEREVVALRKQGPHSNAWASRPSRASGQALCGNDRGSQTRAFAILRIWVAEIEPSWPRYTCTGDSRSPPHVKLKRRPLITAYNKCSGQPTQILTMVQFKITGS